jgi:GWxTD domain-containing protein
MYSSGVFSPTRSRICRAAGRGLLVATFVGLFLAQSLAVSKEKQLAPAYRKWLNHDVVYLITNEEREAFLQLGTDAERDKAMEMFWQIRNPTPAAPTNPYKEEIYRRIEYVNQFFGTPGHDNGWNTDRGRVYITLGEPQQKAPYYNTRETRPMEIWFYQNSNPALPAFFYVIFYQREIGGEFRLYSPNFDGPDKLVTSSLAINNRVKAFQLIDESLGREVARTTLSLIPNEPVDVDRATSSLESDLMLSVIKTLANHPLTKEQLRRNRDLLTNVSHRVVLNGEYLDVLTAVLRDVGGEPSLHYLLRFLKPEDFAMEKSGDRFFYSLRLLTRVFDGNNQLLLEHENTYSEFLNLAQLEQVREKVAGVEGVLPLPHGVYHVRFELTDKVNKTSYSVERTVTVAEPPARGLQLSEMMPFWNAEAVDTSTVTVPFAIAGVKFRPRASDNLRVVPGQDLRLTYQIWSQFTDREANRGKKLQIEYKYGRPGASGDIKTITEELSREQFDAHGSLVTGKSLPTTDLQPGSYRLVVSVADPETQSKAFSGINFQIAEAVVSDAWDVWDQKGSARSRQSLQSYERGVIYQRLGNADQAQMCLARALQEDPEDDKARGRLASLYYKQAKYEKVVSLYSNAEVSKLTEDEDVLNLADSLAKTGQMDKAIAGLENAMSLRSHSEAVYLTLASYYEQTGRSDKAEALRKKARVEAQ